LEHSDVDASYFDKTMPVKDCPFELMNAKAKFKDVLDEATSNGYIYEVEVATARVESRYPHLIEDNVMQAQERVGLIASNAFKFVALTSCIIP
jgi:hypothetical protein